MKLKKLLLILIPAVLVCTAGVIALIFFSPGYHSLFGWHRFSIDGTCMIYDLQAQDFREDTTLHIHECQREQSDIRKGQFVVEGYLDEEALGQHAEEGTFYGHASYYGVYGNDSLNCIVTKYTTVPKVLMEDVNPCAVLNYDRKKNVCVITLYQRVENGEIEGLYEREDLYVAFYGFSNREDALAYFKAVKQ